MLLARWPAALRCTAARPSRTATRSVWSTAARALHATPPRVAATAPPPPRVAATAARVATPKSAASPYSEGLRQSEGLQLILPAACVIGAGGIVYSAARWQDPTVEQWGGRTRRRVNAVYSYVAGTIAGCVFVSVT
jgi:hypothetical protein